MSQNTAWSHKDSPALLAFDTATEACSVALQYDGQLLVRFEELDRGHAERILPMIDEVLREAAMTLRDLDAIAFGRGPGAFTGVRLAASGAQGLAYGANLPVVPVSNLAALAVQALQLDAAATHVWVATDARMQEIYCASYQRTSVPGAPAILGQESVVGGNALALPPAELTPFASTRIVAIGRALSAYPAVAARLAGWCAASFDAALPRAADLLALASQQFAAGCAVSAELALPVYVRDDVVRAPVTPMQ
ncbi:MAG: tRNA (adenosine(37)-N6)-threonylcarbamoyltransferase complex dimerization subunit type 1 TsaB [Proteobacteria bacterium]|nr:tRNA (adenosine(37)-N6)-threonylcarbamoyltransferase complex dimerization subunit type 1 TsaB [Pseudomonadota bacterium]